ncbi:MAG: epoxyqueuosine reductase [Alphaproteobacteria bacterium]|jgi:epoxyqueuosine reductase
MDTVNIIKNHLLNNGFDQVKAIAKKDFPNIASQLHPWLEAGYHGELHWLINNAQKRASAAYIWDQVQSAFVVTLNYAPETDPRPDFDRNDRTYVSVYARNNDYHDIMKKRLKQVTTELKGIVNCRFFVDTAPIAEKPIAQKAGLGWQGKHTNLVSREFGSWTFLGVLLTDLVLDNSDAPEIDHCGSCTKCLTACPTDAFTKPYVMDARRCISYLTIEYKGYIPDDLAVKFGNRIYGCDDCLAACPWNKFAKASHEIGFKARSISDNPPYETLLMLTEETFRQQFSKSPIKRIGYERFIRNVLIAAGNSKNPALIPFIKPYGHSDNEVVKKTALFALNRIQDN